MSSAAILDVDGTLVDTNYHHAIAWWRAFKQNDILVPIWRIHRTVGMGADKMIAELCGEEVERAKGDDIRDAEKALYLALIEEVVLLDGARDLIKELKGRGHSVVLASSAKSNELDHYLDLLEGREIVDGWTDSSDVEATKPDPDLVKAAMEKAGTEEAVLVGDSVWDCEAAKRAGIETIGVLTGGFSEDELEEAGASTVFKSLRTLIDGLDETPLS